MDDDVSNIWDMGPYEFSAWYQEALRSGLLGTGPHPDHMIQGALDKLFSEPLP